MRYCGSKKKFMKDLCPILMEYLEGHEERYFVDAFMGGANVISEIPHKNKIGVELNKNIFSLWKHIQSNGCDSIPLYVTSDDYYKIKADYLKGSENTPDWLVGYVGSCCSYGGAWFNGYAKYNEKRGEDHIAEARRGLLRQVDGFKFLDRTIFCNCSSEKIGDFSLPEGSVIYCDPPYFSTKGYESKFDHDRFWRWAEEMSERGYYVYVSEYTAPMSFKCIWEKKKKDGMAKTAFGERQKEQTEKLFVYKG